MAIRFTGTGISSAGINWTINIIDTDYSGASTSFNLGPDIFTHSYDNENQERYNPINGSRVVFSMSIANATHEALITDLAGSAEERFFVEIERNGSRYFIGMVLLDISRIEDISFPYRFKITAVDGIGRLKEVDYKPKDSSPRYTGRDTLIDHLIKVLSHTGLADQYDTADPFLVTTFDWWEDQMVYNAANDSLTLVNFSHDVFTKLSDNGEYDFSTASEVLKNICLICGAKIYYARGVYRFEQIGERKTISGNFREVTYTKEGTELSLTTTANYSKTVNQTSSGAKLAGLEYTFFPGLHHVQVRYEHESDRNLLQGFEINTLNEGPFNVGLVQYNSNVELQLQFSGSLRYYTNFVDYQNHRVKFRIKLEVESTVWYRRDQELNGGLYGTPEIVNELWSTSEQFVEFYTPIILETQLGNWQELPISFVTKELNYTGDLIFSLYDWQVIGEDGNPIPSDQGFYSVTFELIDGYLATVEDGNVKPSTAKTYRVENDLTPNNSAGIDFVVKIGDGPTQNTYNRFQVYNGSEWVNSDKWARGLATATETIQELLIREIMTGQRVPIYRIQGAFIAPNYTPEYLLIVNGDDYLFLGGSMNAGLDEWSGEWFLLQRNGTGISQIEPWVDDTRIPPPAPPPDPPPPIGNVLELISNFQVMTPFTAGTNYTEIAFNGGGQFFQGDILQLVNPLNGYIEEVTVLEDVVFGDTTIAVNWTPQNSFPLNTYINLVAGNPGVTNQIVTTVFQVIGETPPGDTVPITPGDGGAVDPDCPILGDICAIYTNPEYASGATNSGGLVINKEGLRLYVTGDSQPSLNFSSSSGREIPTNYRPVITGIAIGPSTNWTSSTDVFFYVVPPEYTGLSCDQLRLSVAMVGSGSGSSSVALKQNGVTKASITITGQQATYSFTEFAVSDGDVLLISVSGIQSTPAKGLIVEIYFHE